MNQRKSLKNNSQNLYQKAPIQGGGGGKCPERLSQNPHPGPLPREEGEAYRLIFASSVIETAM